MEDIGSEVRRTLVKETEVEVVATQFSVLETRFRPHLNKVDVEVVLYDNESKIVGPTLWLTLSSTPEQYEALLHKKFEDINALVKGKVQVLWQ